MSRAVTIAALIVLGVLVLLGASATDDGSYAQALLTNLGTGVLLFALLYLVQQKVLDVVRATETRTTQRVDQVRQEVTEVRQELREAEVRMDELAGKARAAVREDEEELIGAVEGIAESVSLDGLLAAFNAAGKLNGIDLGGVRAAIPGAGLWLRFTPMVMKFVEGSEGPPPPLVELSGGYIPADAISLTIEEVTGNRIRNMIWQQPRTPIEVAQWLATQLQTLERYPGESFDPVPVFREIASALRMVVMARLGREEGLRYTIGPLIEVVNDEWVLTTGGLDCIVERYEIDKEHINQSWLREHMSGKVWFDQEKFDQAYQVASAYFGRTRGFTPP